MGWIANRIKAEYRKHSKFKKDWTEIAEWKIKMELLDRGLLKEGVAKRFEKLNKRDKK